MNSFMCYKKHYPYQNLNYRIMESTGLYPNLDLWNANKLHYNFNQTS